MTLREDLAIKQQEWIKHSLLSKKIFAYGPTYLLVSYKMMIGLRHRIINGTQVRYPFFRGNFMAFLGAGIYF